jgi:hypothetical protein
MRKIFRGLLVIAMVMAFSVSGFATEAMGLYQVRANDRYSTFLDTVAWSYMARGRFNVQITFQKNEISKIDKKSAMASQFNFLLTLDEYHKIFESNKELVGFQQNDHIWARKISAKTVDGKRYINVKFENAVDDEVTDVFKRGTLEIVLENDKISLMRMFKEKKRFLGFGGYKTIFKGEARNMKRTVKGLALRDEGEMGRVSSVKAVKNRPQRQISPELQRRNQGRQKSVTEFIFRFIKSRLVLVYETAFYICLCHSRQGNCSDRGILEHRKLAYALIPRHDKVGFVFNCLFSLSRS